MRYVFLAVVLSLVLLPLVSSTTRIPFSISIQSSADNVLKTRRIQSSTAFQHHSISNISSLVARKSQSVSTSTKQNYRIHDRNTALLNNNNMNNDDISSSSFLSTSKANVSFDNKRSSDSTSPSNLSTIDQLLLTLTSDRTSLLLGSLGILLILLLRLISFPEDATYEASRSRIDLLGVFAAGSVLLNGITKLDVESVQAERVMLEGINQDKVIWNENQNSSLQGRNDKFQSTVEWALTSFLKCTPAQSVVLLATQQNSEWIPLATVGILPSEEQLRSSISSDLKTPILDRMLREDGSIKGGTVGGTEVVGSTRRKGASESYLPTLQALPGRVEFTYLPSNAQEALLLPVTRPDDDDNYDGWFYAVVLGGDKAKSFAPRDIAWCKEIASLIGDVL